MIDEMNDERIERLIGTLRDSCSRGPGLCDTHGDAIAAARSLERELTKLQEAYRFKSRENDGLRRDLEELREALTVLNAKLDEVEAENAEVTGC